MDEKTQEKIGELSPEVRTVLQVGSCLEREYITHRTMLSLAVLSLRSSEDWECRTKIYCGCTR